MEAGGRRERSVNASIPISKSGGRRLCRVLGNTSISIKGFSLPVSSLLAFTLGPHDSKAITPEEGNSFLSTPTMSSSHTTSKGIQEKIDKAEELKASGDTAYLAKDFTNGTSIFFFRLKLRRGSVIVWLTMTAFRGYYKVIHRVKSCAVGDSNTHDLSHTPFICIGPA